MDYTALLTAIMDYYKKEHLKDALMVISYTNALEPNAKPKMLELKGAQEFFNTETNRHEVELMFLEDTSSRGDRSFMNMTLTNLDAYFKELSYLRRNQYIPVNVRAITDKTQEKLSIVGTVGVLEMLGNYTSGLPNSNNSNVYAVLLEVKHITDDQKDEDEKLEQLKETFYCDLLQRNLTVINRLTTVTNNNSKDSEEAEMLINQNLLHQYQEQIDKALERGDKEAFLRLTEEYKRLSAI